MERTISEGRTVMAIPQKRVIQKITPEIEIMMPGRGSIGPVRVGKLLEPIKEIMSHPDRDRLMAELFKDYK